MKRLSLCLIIMLLTLLLVSCDFSRFFNKNNNSDNNDNDDTHVHAFIEVIVKPTCTEGGYTEKTCVVCGLVEKTNETAAIEHTYETTYSFNPLFHWYNCENCDSIIAKAEHNVGDDGYCTVCGNQPFAPTEGILYDLAADGTYAEVVGYSGTATNIVIADTYKGVPVKGIREAAFKDNRLITSVVISDSVVTIGAFAFYYCSDLASVIIGNGVTSIGNSAFYGCTTLTNVTIPDSVEFIDANVFYECTSLTSVTIGNGVTIIGDSAFSNCTRLTSVSIGNGVTSIGIGAFYECTSLKSVTIGNGVTTISASAFYGCSKLTNIYYIGSEEEWDKILIDPYNDRLTNATIHYNYVPEE